MFNELKTHNTSFLQKEADRWSRVLKEKNARPEHL